MIIEALFVKQPVLGTIFYAVRCMGMYNDVSKTHLIYRQNSLIWVHKKRTLFLHINWFLETGLIVNGFSILILIIDAFPNIRKINEQSSNRS